VALMNSFLRFGHQRPFQPQRRSPWAAPRPIHSGRPRLEIPTDAPGPPSRRIRTEPPPTRCLRRIQPIPVTARRGFGPAEAYARGVKARGFITSSSSCTEALISQNEQRLWLRAFIAFLATPFASPVRAGLGQPRQDLGIQIRLVGERTDSISRIKSRRRRPRHETRNPLNIVRGLAQ